MKKGIIALLGGALAMGVIFSSGSVIASESKSLQENKLEISTSGGNIDFKATCEENILFTYDKDKYEVDIITEENKQIINITVKDNAEIIFSDRCVVSVPDNISDISIVSDKSGIYLTDIDANIDVDCNYGAASIEAPKNYDKKINYILKYGSGKIAVKDVGDYTISGTIAATTVSAPKKYDFKKVYGKKESCYYKKGEGTAPISIDIEKGTIKFED